MAGVSYRIDDQVALAALDRVKRAAANPRGAMDAIGAHMVFSSQQNIEHETSPDGKKWARLSPRTAAKRIGRTQRGYDHMLRVKLRLYSSISYQATDSGVEWGTNVVYGRIHQLGGVIDQPARQGSVSLKRVRQKGGGIRSRFARAGGKGVETRSVAIGAHQVRIPARPYLGISEFDRNEIPLIVADFLRGEAGR